MNAPRPPSGPAKILATDNGDATDHTVFASAERKAFNGLALAILRADRGATGEIIVPPNPKASPPAGS